MVGAEGEEGGGGREGVGEEGGEEEEEEEDDDDEDEDEDEDSLVRRERSVSEFKIIKVMISDGSVARRDLVFLKKGGRGGKKEVRKGERERERGGEREKGERQTLLRDEEGLVQK